MSVSYTSVRRSRYLEWRRPVDHEVFQIAVGHRHVDSGNLLTPNLDLNFTRVVDEDTVVPVGDIEGDTLVCLVAGRATI